MVVRLFAKVKMRYQRMLQQMHPAVPYQDQQRRPPRIHLYPFRHHLHDRRRQHKTSAQGHEIP